MNYLSKQCSAISVNPDKQNKDEMYKKVLNQLQELKNLSVLKSYNQSNTLSLSKQKYDIEGLLNIDLKSFLKPTDYKFLVFKHLLSSEIKITFTHVLKKLDLRNKNSINYPLAIIVLRFYHEFYTESLISLLDQNYYSLNFLFDKFKLILKQKSRLLLDVSLNNKDNNKINTNNKNIMSKEYTVNNNTNNKRYLKEFSFLFLNTIINILDYHTKELNEQQKNLKNYEFYQRHESLFPLLKIEIQIFKDSLLDLISFQNYYYCNSSEFVYSLLTYITKFIVFSNQVSKVFSVTKFKMIDLIIKEKRIKDWLISVYSRYLKNSYFIFLFYKLISMVLYKETESSAYAFIKYFEPALFVLKKPKLYNLNAFYDLSILLFQIKILFSVSLIINKNNYRDFIEIKRNDYYILINQVNNFLCLINCSKKLIRNNGLFYKCNYMFENTGLMKIVITRNISNDDNKSKNDLKDLMNINIEGSNYKQGNDNRHNTNKNEDEYENNKTTDSEIVMKILLYCFKLLNRLIFKDFLFNDFYYHKNTRQFDVICFYIVSFILVIKSKDDNIEDMTLANKDLYYSLLREMTHFIYELKSNPTVSKLFMLFQKQVKMIFIELVSNLDDEYKRGRFIWENLITNLESQLVISNVDKYIKEGLIDIVEKIKR